MRPDPSAEPFRSFPDLMRFALSDGQVLVYSLWSRAPRVLSALGQRLLQGCASFATLDDHAARLCRELNLMPLQLESVRRELESLAEAGLLLSRQQMADAARRTSRTEGPPRITAVGI